MNENDNSNKTLAMPWGDGKTIFARQLQIEELESVYRLTEEQMSAPVAPIDVSRSVLAHNADAFWGVFLTDNKGGEDPQLVGYAAFLMLNADGAAAMRDGSFVRGNPPAYQLSPSGERPAAVYIWIVVARKFGAVAIPLTTHALGPLYLNIPVYSTAATEAGRSALLKFGFKPLGEGAGDLGDIYCRDGTLDPTIEAARRRMLVSRFKVDFASSANDIEKVFAIRAAVFMAEQKCPYSEEFDGNDRTATHVLGYVDGEPAAALRIRYFADYVKIERLAVLPRYRGTLIAREIVKAAISFCRRKGYQRMYGHAQERLLGFWGHFGFKPVSGSAPFVFSDHKYIEVVGDLDPHPRPIRLGESPYMFIRREGSWDTPGILEASAERPATNPH